MNKKSSPGISLVLLIFFLLLPGCSGVLDSSRPVTNTWWLQPLDSSGGEATTTPVPLVLKLTVVPGLDSNQVLTMEPNARLSQVAGAAWADHLPELLTSLLSRSLATSGRFGPVSSGSRPAADGCVLSLQIERFWLRLDAAQQPLAAEFAASGALSCPGLDRHQTVQLSTSTPVVSTSMPELVAAMQNSFNSLLRELLKQLATA